MTFAIKCVHRVAIDDAWQLSYSAPKDPLAGFKEPTSK